MVFVCLNHAFFCSVPLHHAYDNVEPGTDAGCYSDIYQGLSTNAFHPGRYYRGGNGPRVSFEVENVRRWPNTINHIHKYSLAFNSRSKKERYEKPNLVTIIRSYQKPYKKIKLLLDKHSMQSFEQLMSDICDAFISKDDERCDLKLYTVRGKEVKGMSDLFRDDKYFIAVGNEMLSDSDVMSILQEFYPDAAHRKFLVKAWHKQNRQLKQYSLRLVNKDESEPDKKDSGFVDSGDKLSECIPQPINHQSNLAKVVIKKSRFADTSKHGKLQSGIHLPPLNHSPNNAANHKKLQVRDIRIKQERRSDSLEEAYKQSITDCQSERIAKTSKPLNNVKRKNVRNEQESLAINNEKLRKITNEKKDAVYFIPREEIIAAEQAARSRKADADNVSFKRGGIKDNVTLKNTAGTERKIDDVLLRENGNIKVEKNINAELEKQNISHHDEERIKNVHANNVHDAGAEDRKGNSHRTADDRSLKEGEKENVNYDTTDAINKNCEFIEIKSQSNRKICAKKRNNHAEDVHEQHRKRKNKPRVIHRSKFERQVDNYVVIEKYELGRTIGDGNFAVVHASRLKASGQEIAIKVIDKLKLNGKERMVENEIEIMKDCSHPNIVRLYEEYETIEKIYLVMELIKVLFALIFNNIFCYLL